MPDIEMKITDADRLVLKDVMDIILPPIDDLPAAGEMGLAPIAEDVARQHSRYRSALEHVLDALSLEPSARVEGGFASLDDEQKTNALKALDANMPKYFGLFVDLVYIVYYSDERVQNRIGWRTGPLQPRGWELPPFDPTILETVSKRKPFWRKV